MKDILLLIEKLERGQLSPEEVQELRQKLEQDSGFAAHFQGEWYAYKSIQAVGDQELKQSLLQKSYHPSEGKTRPLRWIRFASILAVAAAALLLLLFYPFNISQPSSPQEAFTQYMDVPFHTSRGNSPQAQGGEWDRALRLYISGNFEQAEQLLVPLVSSPSFSHYSEASLYLGICYLKIQQPDNALNAFAMVKKGSAFFQEAQWFSALGYLHKEDISQASAALREISTLPYHYKSDAAKELLEILDNWK